MDKIDYQSMYLDYVFKGLIVKHPKAYASMFKRA